MATIENRSRITVSVKHRPDLTRTFPFTQQKEALARLHALRADGFKPVLSRADDQFWVRIREKGYTSLNIPVGSLAEADQVIERIASDRKVNLFIDYRRGHLVTMAALVQQYLEQEVPKHKGKAVETYTLKGWIEDSRGELLRLHRARERALIEGRKPEAIKARRKPRRNLEWLQKSFASIVPKEVEGYIVDRLEDGIAAATIDREMDLFSQVCNWAIKVLRINVVHSPMAGVRRPRYFNERDRRLTEEEKDRLFEAAREEDRLRSAELAIEARLSEARCVASGLPNRTAQKRHVAAARAAVIKELAGTYPIVHTYEALLKFLLVTAARRGEALKLEWADLNLDRQTAFFRDTKNGTDRTVPVRREGIPVLAGLPRTHTRVFPITLDDLKGAWRRMCRRAELEDFNLHDMRHCGISEMVEAAFLAGYPLSLLELQAVTGHRDLASLARYTHLCAGHMARRLDECFEKSRARQRVHKGRVRAWSGRGSADGGAPAQAPLGPRAGEAMPGEPDATGSDVLAAAPYNRLPI